MKQDTAYKLNTILFVAILGIMGILFFVLPKQEKSELEKRELCQLPSFSWHEFFKGKYIDSLDLYYADNFPFRDNFVAASFQIENFRGIQSKKVKFYNESVNMDAGIDVRRGAMDREQAVQLVRMYDNFDPKIHYETWCKYYDMTASELEEVFDRWANKDLFVKNENGRWMPCFEIA